MTGVDVAGRSVLADERTRWVKAHLAQDHDVIYPRVQERWDRARVGA